MKHKLRLTVQLIFLLLPLFLQAGCIKKTTVLPQEQRLLPAKTVSRSELLQDLQAQSKKIESLKGTLALEFSRGGAKSGVLDEYRQTKGYVFVERPDHIRVQVQMPLVLTTVAVMVSDGQQFRVSIPIKNQFAIRDVNAPVNEKGSLTDLRPTVFLDGLFVDVSRFSNKPNVRVFSEEAIVGIHSYYVLSFADVTNFEADLLEKIWIDRTDLQVARKQVYGKDGRLEQDVDYQKYHTVDGVPYPEVIVIHRPIEDFTLKMTFQQTTINEKMDAKVFELARPDGSELLQVAQ